MLKTVSALLNFYRKCYNVIGGVILGLGLCLLPFLENLVSGTYPDDVNLYFLYLIYLFNTVIGYFLFAYKKSLLTAFQRNDIDSNISTVTISLQYIIQSLIIVFVQNYYVYLVVLPITTIINNIVTSVIVDRKFPEIRCAGKITAEYSASIKKKISGLVEKESEAGGLCRSTDVDGSPFDIGGGHFLDVRRPQVNEFLFGFMPEEEWDKENSYVKFSRTK